MELILIVFCSAFISLCFFIIYHYAYKKGYDDATDRLKEDLITPNRDNQRLLEERVKFANYNG